MGRYHHVVHETIPEKKEYLGVLGTRQTTVEVL